MLIYFLWWEIDAKYFKNCFVIKYLFEEIGFYFTANNLTSHKRKGKALFLVSLVILTIALFYSSVPVSCDSVHACTLTGPSVILLFTPVLLLL